MRINWRVPCGTTMRVRHGAKWWRRHRPARTCSTISSPSRRAMCS
jgi:hypothetical protein